MLELWTESVLIGNILCPEWVFIHLRTVEDVWGRLQFTTYSGFDFMRNETKKDHDESRRNGEYGVLLLRIETKEKNIANKNTPLQPSDHTRANSTLSS